jgi:F-type H+-transporting ATPase subunit a
MNLSFNLSFAPLPFAAIEVGHHWDWDIAGSIVHGETILGTWIAMSVVIILAFVGTRKLERIPSGLQGFLEYSLSFTAGIARDQIGAKYHKPYIPLVSTIFLFVFASNWLGQIPLKVFPLPGAEITSPSVDINTPFALAVIALCSYLFAGFREAGPAFLKTFFMPVPFFVFFKVLDLFVRPASLTFRLFGNLVAEELVLLVFITLVPFLVPIPLMLLFLFTSAIQALIFATLTSFYIGEAIEEGHHAMEDHHE